MPYAVGIDFGNTSARVAASLHSKVRLLDNPDLSPLTPSVVYLDKYADLLVGEAARQAGARDPANCATSFKRLLGQDFSDPPVQIVIQSLACRVMEDANGVCEYLLQDQRKSPLQLAAAVLEQMRSIAEGELGELSGAVLAVPGWFGLRQRRALQQAAEQAGLKVLQLLPEAAALAMSYGFQSEALLEPQNCLVVNWGGGSFSADVLFCGAGIFQQLASAGDLHLGGDLFDQHILEWALQQVRVQQHVDLRALPDAPQILFRLKMEAEKVKQRLCSTRKPARMLLPALARRGEQLIDLDLELDPGTFESLIQADVGRALELIGPLLRQAGLGQADLDLVILAGGSARIPLVKQRLGEIFGEKLLGAVVHPLHCVAEGSAILAAQLVSGRSAAAQPTGPEGDNPAAQVFVTLPEAIGVRAGARSDGDNFLVLIPAQTLLPMSEKVRRSFRTSRDGQQDFSLPLYEQAGLEEGRKKLLGQVQADLPPGLPAGTELVLKLELDGDGQVLAEIELPARPQVSLKRGSSGKNRTRLPAPSHGRSRLELRPTPTPQ